MKIKPIKASSGATEASGVTRKVDELLIVSDAAPGVYYSVDIHDQQGPLIYLSPDKLVCHEMHGMTLAIDFESIDLLADGRVVGLSERLRSLIGEEGLIFQYDDPLSEFGERGLEGLAVRADQDQVSEVAVLWEGGWVLENEVQKQLRLAISTPLSPIVLTHPLNAGESGLKINIEDDSELIELKVPQPDQETNGWRFRAPDLVWHEWHRESSKLECGFIVLLNSQAPHGIPTRSQYGPCWLQRFNRAGEPVGEHLDLDQLAKEQLGDNRLQGANWEGLGWYEIGKRLIVVHDESKNLGDVPVAFLIDLPDSWL